MNQINTDTQKSFFFYIILYSIITFIFLSFLSINAILLGLSQKKQNKSIIYNRRLQIEINQTNNETSLNDTLSTQEFSTDTLSGETFLSDALSNETNVTSEEAYLESDNPFIYLTGYYLIFVMMSAYMICFVNRSNTSPEYKERVKSDIYKFLFIANNGSLLVSIIYLAEVYRASGFAPFTIGLLILIIGSLCYLKNLSDGCLAEFFHPDKIKYLCNIPCMIIKLVKVTYECCRCEYYNIETIKVYRDGTVVKETWCTSIICLIWNIICLMIKIVSTFFTVISYYIFLGFFWVIWKIFQIIYLKHLAEEKNQNNNENENVDNQPVNENVDNQPVDSHINKIQTQVINVVRNNDNNQVNVIVNNNIGQSDINTNNQYMSNIQNNYTSNIPRNSITNPNYNNDSQHNSNINFSNKQRNDINYNNYYKVKRDGQEEKIDSERGEILDVNRKPKKPSNNINNNKDYDGENKNIYNINNVNKNADNINDGSNIENNNQGYNNNENNYNQKPAPNLGEFENHYAMNNEEEENKGRGENEERPNELEFNNNSQSEDKLYDVII